VSLTVLVVSHGHPQLSPGGAEQAAYQLFDGLRRVEGVKAHFLAWAKPTHFRPGQNFSNFRDCSDETIFCTDKFDRFYFSQPSRRLQANFLTLLNRIDPDVIHFHHYLNVGLEFIAIARWTKPHVRILVTLHEYLAICHHFGLMVKTAHSTLCHASEPAECARCFPQLTQDDFAQRELRIRSYFDQVDLFVAPSEFLRDRYVAWGMPAGQIVVLDNGTRSVGSRLPRARVAKEGRVSFGYFGQIHPYKGLLELLSAFAQLSKFPQQATKGIRLIIHGAHLEQNEPDYVASFQRLLANVATRVHFAGPYSHQELKRLMAEVDWVVVPSIWWENSPLVIQEAFAHRRPVVCSNIGGMAEKVRPGLDGYHFPVGDAAALAKLLVKLAADGTIWDRLQTTMRRPMTMKQSVSAHLRLYRDRSLSSSVSRVSAYLDANRSRRGGW